MTRPSDVSRRYSKRRTLDQPEAATRITARLTEVEFADADRRREILGVSWSEFVRDALRDDAGVCDVLERKIADQQTQLRGLSERVALLEGQLVSERDRFAADLAAQRAMFDGSFTSSLAERQRITEDHFYG
jgi:hypothetical protein